MAVYLQACHRDLALSCNACYPTVGEMHIQPFLILASSRPAQPMSRSVLCLPPTLRAERNHGGIAHITQDQPQDSISLDHIISTQGSGSVPRAPVSAAMEKKQIFVMV
ncbi:hypothetical protein CUC08_Gglean013255 [Alternaria sp. MG1]|nr:hypothetical protein CUC08_Gglean013255 [Alternaria sp. MG1]